MIDTGASDHMFHNKDPFSTLKVLFKPSTVTLPDVKCVSVTHVGTVIPSHVLTLRGVLYVPSFRYNLLSISKMASQMDGYFFFTPKYCFMQAPSLKKPLVLGGFYAGLDLLKVQSFKDSLSSITASFIIEKQSSICSSSSLFSEDIWHARLGYLPLTKLQ